jgi:phage terminase small subunit
MKALSRREEAFVESVVGGKTATQAAIDAGYAPRSAPSRASKLARRGKIIAAINARREVAVAQAQETTNITVARLFEELGRVGLSDPKDLCGPDGRLLPLHALPEGIRRAIASCEVEEIYAPDPRPNGHLAESDRRLVRIRTTKVKFWNKLQAIEAIATIAGYTREESKVGGEVVLRWASEDE